MEVMRNECVDCGQVCLGISCPNRKVTHFVCDNCGEDIPDGELYEVEDIFVGEKHWCRDCVERNLSEFKEYYDSAIKEFLWDCINADFRKGN